MAEFLADQNLGLIIGGIIAEIFESEFEKILNNDHTGVADDVGAVIWLGNLKRPYQSWWCY